MSVLRIRRPGAAPRRRGILAAVLAIGLSASACSDHVGAGAVIGSTTIPESSIQSQASQVLAQNPQAASLTTADQIRVTRSVATTAIRHVLIQQAAAAHGITIDEAEINAALSQIGGSAADTAASLGVPVGNLDDYIRDYMTLERLLRKEGAAAAVDNVTVKIDYLVVAGRDAAIEARSRYVRDPAAMAADIAAAKPAADGSATGGTNQSLALLTQPTLGSTGLFAARQGDTLVIQGGTGSYLVVKVTGRAQQQAPLTAASIPSSGGPAEAVAVLSLLLAPTARLSGVTVNPRYGVWDPVSLQVVPGDLGV